MPAPTWTAVPVPFERLTRRLWLAYRSVLVARVLLAVFALRGAGLSNACSFVCAPARANVVGQATWRSLLEAVHLVGVVCEAKKN